MAKKLKITVGGRDYPCRVTMGAMWRFRQETGREVTDIDAGSMTDLLVWLWCCVSSACSADGVDFGMDIRTFADQLSPEEMSSWSAGQVASPENLSGEDAAEKKT